MVLELDRQGAIDRPVTGVVDAGCELVGEHPAADVEELEGEHADVAQRRRAAPATGSPSAAAPRSVGAASCDRIPSRRTFSPTGQNRVSPSPPPHRDDRELTVEGDELLRELSLRAERTSCRRPPLALAVVAETTGLARRRRSPGYHQEPKPGGRNAETTEGAPSPPDDPAPTRAHAGPVRAHPRSADGDRDVLELEGDARRAIAPAGRERRDRSRTPTNSSPTSPADASAEDRGTGTRGRAGCRASASIRPS